MSQTLFTAKAGLNEMHIVLDVRCAKRFELNCNFSRDGRRAWGELPRRYDTLKGARLGAARIAGQPLAWERVALVVEASEAGDCA